MPTEDTEANSAAEKRLCSACLVGTKCYWDGKDRTSPNAKRLFDKGLLIPVCPERLGGLPTPRIPLEIQGGTGVQVLDGQRRIKNKAGQDVTEQVVMGAQEALRMAMEAGVREFIGKSRSPSCGCGKVYDGTFRGHLIDGDGVTVALLKRNGIRVITDEEL